MGSIRYLFVRMCSGLCCLRLLFRFMLHTRTAWSASTAADGAMMTGNAATVITAVTELTETAIMNIIADRAVIVWKTAVCAMTANFVLSAVNVRINAAVVMKPQVTSAMCAEQNARNVLISSVTTAGSAPNAPAMNCTVPIVCCALAVRSGSAIAERAARNVPLAVRSAMRNVRSVQVMSFAFAAGSALTA